MYVRACACVWVHVWVCACLWVLVCMCVYNVCAYMCLCVHVFVCMCACMHMCLCVHTCACACACVYVCVRVYVCSSCKYCQTATCTLPTVTRLTDIKLSTLERKLARWQVITSTSKYWQVGNHMVVANFKVVKTGTPVDAIQITRKYLCMLALYQSFLTECSSLSKSGVVSSGKGTLHIPILRIVNREWLNMWYLLLPISEQKKRN